MDVLTRQKLRIGRARLQEHIIKGTKLESDWDSTAQNCLYNQEHGLCANPDNKHEMCNYVICPELDE